MSTTVWFQLVPQGRVPQGRVTQVQKPKDAADWNIAAFVTALKTDVLKQKLEHVDVDDIYVYPHETPLPIRGDAVAYEGWDEVPSTNPLPDSKRPRYLFVEAKPQQWGKQKGDDDGPNSPKRAKTPEEILRLVAFKAPEIKAREESELFGRVAAKEGTIKYLKGCIAKDNNYIDKSNKFSMLGVSGVKGIGKTELLYQITERWAKEALGEDARTLYLSYNGGGKAGDYCMDPVLMKKYSHDGGDGVLDSVGHLMLASYGAEVMDAVQIPFDKALDHLRGKMGCQSHSTLVICIDEVIELDKRNGTLVRPTLAQKVMSDCMRKQNELGGKVVFIFTAILDSMFDQMKALSGREVKPLPLNMIPLSNVFGNLLPEKLASAAATHPAVHQLVLSCAGHPRAVVDGLGNAANVDEILEGTPASLISVRTKIVRKCKLKSKDLDEAVLREWFDLQNASNRLRENLLAKGVLLSVGAGEKTEFLFPLLVQDWATKTENKGSPFAFHLKGLFEADLTLGPSSEKQIEPVMYHFEAVVRKAMDKKEFDLTEFYKSDHVAVGFPFGTVTAVVPPGASNLVRFVEDFSNITNVIALLKYGYIVVSKNPTKTGVEYLSPFVQANQRGLVVACIQCKFVKDKTTWSTINEKMERAMKALKGKGISCVPVVYTTADRKKILDSSTYENGIYFVEKDLFELTKKVGLLRLHTQKLGAVLSNEYPFLKGSP